MSRKELLKRIKYSLRFLPDKVYLQLYYFLKFKRFINFNNPKTFNEKLNWLKINDRKSKYSNMVDKYEAKKSVAKILGKEYIVPTLGIYERFDDIDFNKLPNQFVIKCTHDSEGLYIVNDKNKLNIKEAKEKIENAMKYNFFYIGREWPYKNIKPRILVEEYIEDEETHELRDYKFFCFDGKVFCFKIDFNRSVQHRANYYDTKGNLLKIGEEMCPPDYNKELKMPLHLKEMIKYAEKLSKDIPFLRVDFYEKNGIVFFGELTFFPASGFGKFLKNETDLLLGDWIKLK